MDHQPTSQNFITTYLAINADKFPKESLSFIEQKLHTLSQEKQIDLQNITLKDPTLALLLSFFFGTFAIDRFYIGNITLGILKLLTIGGCGIWTIIDWFIMMKITRQQNLEKFKNFFKDPTHSI